MTRPRIGLALGRGWSHIGVIDTLTEAGIKPDIICGTSMGARIVEGVAAVKLGRPRPRRLQHGPARHTRGLRTECARAGSKAVGDPLPHCPQDRRAMVVLSESQQLCICASKADGASLNVHDAILPLER